MSTPLLFLPQLQMEKLASRHAITELMSWISLMENIIQEDQNKIMGAVGSEAVQDFLQKYKVRAREAVLLSNLLQRSRMIQLL